MHEDTSSNVQRYRSCFNYKYTYGSRLVQKNYSKAIKVSDKTVVAVLKTEPVMKMRITFHQLLRTQSDFNGSNIFRTQEI